MIESYDDGFRMNNTIEMVFAAVRVLFSKFYIQNYIDATLPLF